MPEENEDQGSRCSANLDLSGLDIVDGKHINNEVVPAETIKKVTAEEVIATSQVEVAKSKAAADTSTAQTKAEADVSVAQAEADARIAEAEAKARVASVKADADIKAAQQIASSKVAAEKSKRRAKTFGRIKRKLTIKVIIAILVVVAVIAVAGAITWKANKAPVHINSSQITKVVAVSDLSVVDFSYEGIAEYKGDGHEENPIHVHYRAKVKASFNPSEIKYEIDDEKKTVTPILPPINISSPNVDDHINFLEGDTQSIDISSVLNACKDDAAAEVEAKSNIKEIAINNAHKAIESLSMNLLDSEGYEITWPNEGSASAQKREGDNNAA